MANAPHHKTPRYVHASRRLRQLANANPHTVCWRCGLTLDRHKPGDTWTAGHTIDGSNAWQPWPHITEPPPPGDWLAPEARSCNYSAGATTGNHKRNEPTTPW